jgi:hypothetical protein
VGGAAFTEWLEQLTSIPSPAVVRVSHIMPNRVHLNLCESITVGTDLIAL